MSAAYLNKGISIGEKEGRNLWYADALIWGMRENACLLRSSR